MDSREWQKRYGALLNEGKQAQSLATCMANRSGTSYWALFSFFLCIPQFLLGVDAGPRTLHVPTEYAEVHLALSAARDGDTILVAPGEYVFTDPLTFEGKGLRLISEAGAEQTTLRIAPRPPDGPFEKPPPQRASVLIFEQGEPAGSLVKGFLITGGLGTDAYGLCGHAMTDYDPVGGGISILKGARVTIQDCRVQGNRADGGGGISCAGGSVTLQGCQVSGNSGWLTNPRSGGGLNCVDGGEAYLEHCYVNGNDAQFGAGLSVSCDSRITAIACDISGNIVHENGIGAAVSCDRSELTLEDCTLSRNCRPSFCLVAGAMNIVDGSFVEIRNCQIESSDAEAFAGGISVRSGAFLHIQGSRISDNSSEESGGIDCRDAHILLESSILEGNWAGGGGGLRVEQSTGVLKGCLIWKNGYDGVQVLNGSTLEVVNCTIADNCQTGLSCWQHTDVTVHNSILWRNGYDLCGSGADIAHLRDEVVVVTHSLVGSREVWPGEGNLNSDPLFVGPSIDQPDYHLQPGSPAIDTGTASGAPDHDIEGKARPCGRGVDMGAYEFGGCEPKRFRRGDINGSGALELTDAVLILSYLFLGETDPPCLDAADAEDDGQVSITDAIYLLSSLFLGGPSPPAPDSTCGSDPTPDEVLCQGDLGCGG